MSDKIEIEKLFKVKAETIVYLLMYLIACISFLLEYYAGGIQELENLETNLSPYSYYFPEAICLFFIIFISPFVRKKVEYIFFCIMIYFLNLYFLGTILYFIPMTSFGLYPMISLALKTIASIIIHIATTLERSNRIDQEEILEERIKSEEEEKLNTIKKEQRIKLVEQEFKQIESNSKIELSRLFELKVNIKK